jgi:4-diphosphocytidyl-2-C-methyl-D-erythritol kinase
LSKAELEAYAARIGADVPFCLYPLSAVGHGRGDELTAAPEGPLLWLVLVKPPFGLSTGEIYQHLANVTINKRPGLAEVLQGMAELDLPKVFGNMANVLEAAAFDLQPRLLGWQQDLQAYEADHIMMTGSGPTLVAFFSNEEKARNLAARWKQPRWEVLLSRTLTKEELENRMIHYESIEESE